MQRDGERLIYFGPITRDANRRLFALAAGSATEDAILEITSAGGDVEAGLELGRWVHDRSLPVRVTEYCMSSCANYVFTAAPRRELSTTAFLLWHGGMQQRVWSGAPQSDMQTAQAFAGQLAELRATEREFFETVGVDPRITVLGQSADAPCRDADGWDYALDDLAALGVDVIMASGDEWRPTPPSPEIRACRLTLGQTSAVDGEERGNAWSPGYTRECCRLTQASLPANVMQRQHALMSDS